MGHKSHCVAHMGLTYQAIGVNDSLPTHTAYVHIGFYFLWDSFVGKCKMHWWSEDAMELYYTQG